MSRVILVVNGSPDRPHPSRDLLERAGYQVREVVSLESTLSIARETQPLAVVVEAPPDRDVPVAFARRLRLHPVTRDVPILVLAPPAEGDAPTESSSDVIWLPEPCPPRTLLEEIAYITRTGRAVPPGGAFGPPPSPDPERRSRGEMRT